VAIKIHIFSKICKKVLDIISKWVYNVLAHRGDKGKLPNTKQKLKSH
jgi:hypothetical protein